MKSIKGQFLAKLPRNAFIYRICKSYVNHFNGENNDDIHNNGELRLMHDVLPQCEIVFDVGANIGEWAALALSVNPRLQVHCFEPSAITIKRLQTRGVGTICNNFGLSSVPGETTLWVFAEGAGTNSVYRRHGLEDGWGLTEQKMQETVRMDTLDAYCQRLGIQAIDFMKADVEGHELEVFKGAVGMLSQGKIKHIQFEYGGCNIDSRVLLKDFFDFFEPYGYTFYKILPRELLRIPRYDQRLENFQHQNWMAVR